MHRTFSVYGDVIALPDDVRVPGATLGAPSMGKPITFEQVATLSNRGPSDAPHSDVFSFSRLSENVDQLCWHPYCLFELDYAGRRARCVLNGSLGKEAFEDYYLSQVISFFFVRENREPLHASVVSDGSHAVALLGDSGAGKSSMVAALLASGWRLVTDDLAMLDIAGDRCHVHPGLPRLKLYPDVASKYCSEKVLADSARRLSTKLVCHLDRNSYQATSVALDCCVMLRRTSVETPEVFVIERCTPVGGFFELLKNTYNSVSTDEERRRVQFAFLSRVASLVSVYGLTYRSDLGLLDEVSARLAQEVRRRHSRLIGKPGDTAGEDLIVRNEIVSSH